MNNNDINDFLRLCFFQLLVMILTKPKHQLKTQHIKITNTDSKIYGTVLIFFIVTSMSSTWWWMTLK